MKNAAWINRLSGRERLIAHLVVCGECRVESASFDGLGLCGFVGSFCLLAKHIGAGVATVVTAPPAPVPVVTVARSNSCNRHDDCDTARANAEKRGVNVYAGFCCHDDCCEECFGN